HVGQDWAERAALRRTRFRSDDNAVLHDAGPEPFTNQAQDDPVCNAVRHHPSQPLMIDMVEVSANVGLVEMSHFVGDQRDSQGPQRVVWAASRPKSIRAVQKIRLEHCFDDARDRTLYQSVFDRRNTQRPRTDFPGTFRNLHPAYRWRSIGAGFQPCANVLDSCLQLALELRRRLPVHSACAAPVHLPPGLDEKRWREQMRQRREAQCAVCLRLGRNLFQLCGHPTPTSERRGCGPGPASRPAPPLPRVRGFPARRVLPADPTSTTASAFLWMVHSVGLLEAVLKTVVDLPGSVTLPWSARAVLSDPAGVSGPLASSGGLLMPSKYSTLSASGLPTHEAQSLHLRYGPDVALPTLSPCRCLHEPKARFQVERLIPLAWAGVAPAGSARLRLARRKTFRGRGPRHTGSRSPDIPVQPLPPDVPTALAESRSCGQKTLGRRWAEGPAALPAGQIGRARWGRLTSAPRHRAWVTRLV